ncbi:Na(+)/H(+) exchange regulatory cofactor NHE-RF2-like [Chrysoperla carnea]|uniref:Na(+)/H(+) exchange regulatory cofactor NHE-RF2-like n=1 Tax=Chrysoperla carnea TaxID=189513 RepID=UPI001D063C4E|nr:Na(+)/H(+) exchange regulatory cofactor NHE-RF2-like [Chrysoperla carnea]
MSQVNDNGNAIEGARLCHIIKSPKFEGYGFNLHAEKSKPGQFIGKVDEGSPAEAAGLRQGDRILQVNGVDIANENHKQVVERIKQDPNETKLLVCSPNTEDNNTQTLNTKVTEKNHAENNSSPPNSNNHTNNETNQSIGLKLNMTAAELRAQLANRKKYDPKKETIDFKKKFDIVQKL